MSTAAVRTPARPRFGARVWGAVVAGWGVVAGVTPHVLHHIGPLAGAALLAGFGGQALFFAAGLLLSVPMLRRLYRRFGTPAAPALAVVVFAALFIFSSLVVAPWLTGSQQAPLTPGVEQPTTPTGHAGHHSGGK